MGFFDFLKKNKEVEQEPEIKFPDFTEKEVALLKKQYTKLKDNSEKQSKKANENEEDRVKKANSQCPKCQMFSVTDRIKRQKGEIEGSSSGSGSIFGGYSHGSIKGDWDTYAVNKCGSCKHEWTKVERTRYYEGCDPIGTALIGVEYLGSWWKGNVINCTFDPNDITEKYNNLEEKREAAKNSYKDKNTLIDMSRQYFKGYSIEVVVQLVKEYTHKYDWKNFVDDYDEQVMKEIFELKNIKEFIK